MGDNACDLLFAFLQTKSQLKWGLLQKEKHCKFFPLRLDPYLHGRHTHFEMVAFLTNVSILLKVLTDLVLSLSRIHPLACFMFKKIQVRLRGRQFQTKGIHLH